MNNMNEQRSKSNIDFDLASLLGTNEKTPKLHIKKYLNYLIAKKYWIFFSAVIFSVLWYFGHSYYKNSVREFTTSTIIRFDDPRSSRNISALTDFSSGIATQGRAKILHTNMFLKKVVDSLKLNIFVPDNGIPRRLFIKSVEFSDRLKYGSYYFKILNDIKLFYVTQKDEKKEVLIKKFPLTSRDSLIVDAGGFKAVFAIPSWFDGNKLPFYIVPDLYAANMIRAKLFYYLERRSNNILTISFSNKDPQYAKYVCNKIASLYIEHLLEFKKYKTTSILKSLQEQLRVSKAQLKYAERNLQRFQEKNPRVYLTQDRGENIKELAEKEITVRTVRGLKRQISEFESKLSLSTDLREKNYIYQEILSFLEQQNLPGVSVFIANLSQEIIEIERLYRQRLPESSPDVLRVKERIANIQRETDKRLRDYKNELNQQENSTFSEINQAERVLNKIPRKQLQLAELERERQIKAGIVSSIMSRFNEAKVSDAAIIPDAQIIDYAEAPIIYPEGLLQKLITLIIGAIIGIAFSIAVLILLVLTNGKFWTSDELEEKTGLPVYAKLPILNSGNGKFPTVEHKIDPMLITYSYEPTMGGESFRKMRTILELDEKKNKDIILVGSMNPSEGKSFVSLNLATVYAQQKQKVLLIDGDVRKGVLHSFFTNIKKPGLTEMLISNSSMSHELISYYVQKTEVPNLYLMSSGQLVPNPAELLSSNRFGELLAFLAKSFSKIVIDSAPFGLCTDLFIMNKWVNNILLVTKYKSTNINDLKKFLNEFQEVKDDFRGIAVNFINEKNKRYGYSGYNYYKY